MPSSSQHLPPRPRWHWADGPLHVNGHGIYLWVLDAQYFRNFESQSGEYWSGPQCTGVSASYGATKGVDEMLGNVRHPPYFMFLESFGWKKFNTDPHWGRRGVEVVHFTSTGGYEGHDKSPHATCLWDSRCYRSRVSIQPPGRGCRHELWKHVRRAGQVYCCPYGLGKFLLPIWGANWEQGPQKQRDTLDSSLWSCSNGVFLDS